MAKQKDISSWGIVIILGIAAAVKAMDYWFITLPVVATILVVRYLARRAKTPAEFSSGSFDADDFAVEIVGESRYQENLIAICGGRTKEGANKVVSAKCVPSSDADTVWVEIGKRRVGCLDDEDAEDYRRRFGSQASKCQALIRGGWDRGDGDVGNFGVRLNVGLV